MVHQDKVVEELLISLLSTDPSSLDEVQTDLSHGFQAFPMATPPSHARAELVPASFAAVNSTLASQIRCRSSCPAVLRLLPPLLVNDRLLDLAESLRSTACS